MKQQYKFVVPEGGWGYVVCLGMSLPFIQMLGLFSSFALLYGDFLKEHHEETGALTLISGTYFGALSVSGLFANLLFQRYSLRKVAICSGFLYLIGSISQVFVTSTMQLLVSHGVIQGLSAGIMVPACYTCFNSYFERKKVTMLSLTKCLIGLGTMVYPIIIERLYSWYGFRACLMLIAASNMNTILGLSLLHPVEWHMKQIPLTSEEMDEIDKEDPKQVEPLMEQKPNKNSLRRESSYYSDVDTPKQLSYSRRASSIASLANWVTPVVVSDVDRAPSSSGKGKLHSIIKTLDLKLFAQPIYLNILLGINCALYSDVAFFSLQPMYLDQLNYSKSDIAAIIAIGAAADSGSRLAIALVSTFWNIPARHLYLLGAVGMIILRLAIPSVFSFTAMAVLSGSISLLRTFVHVPVPLIFADYLPKDRFASGYGLYMFVHGSFMFIVGPIVGYIRDRTKDYIFTFHILNVFMAVCAVPWILEIIYLRYFKKPEPVHDAVAETEESKV